MATKKITKKSAPKKAPKKVTKKAPPKKVAKIAVKDYDDLKARKMRRDRILSSEGRDIVDIPDVVDPKRKKSCELDFGKFCKTYFPDIFKFEWSEDHLIAIQKIESAVIECDLFAIALPRGSGKTSLCTVACLWATLYGHHNFVVLVAATAIKANNLLDNIKIWLETSELLYQDFPAACYPIRKLERIHMRCNGQTHYGRPTRMDLSAKMLMLADIEGADSAGAIITACGLTGGEIRGQQIADANGNILRPTLVLIDDPSTRESAVSPSQNQTRYRIITGDVLGMAGPGKRMSGLMAGTVIARDDLCHRMLDRDKTPDWRGYTGKMLKSMPKNLELWDEYASIKRAAILEDDPSKPHLKFYKKHRKELDDGAIVSWPERKSDDDISALQHSMDLYFRDSHAFAAEYQNEPVSDDIGSILITMEDLYEKCNGADKYICLPYSSKLTMFIDVQGELLYYSVVCFEDDMTSSVVDYGTWPQNQGDFLLRTASKTLSKAYPNMSLEARLGKALDDLISNKMSKAYQIEGGGDKYIDMIGIDANWGQSTEIVYTVCKKSQHAARLMPCHGRYVGATSKPMAEQRKQRGDKIGLNWKIPRKVGDRTIRHLNFDTNFWKSILYERWSLPFGDKSCLGIYGKRPHLHKNFFEHLLAEVGVQVTAKGKTKTEFKLLPNRDNHWLDCITGCFVLANTLGITAPMQKVTMAQKQSISLKSIQNGDMDKVDKIAKKSDTKKPLKLSSYQR